jgi:hypothetical protein
VNSTRLILAKVCLEKWAYANTILILGYPCGPGLAGDFCLGKGVKRKAPAGLQQYWRLRRRGISTIHPLPLKGRSLSAQKGLFSRQTNGKKPTYANSTVAKWLEFRENNRDISIS